MKKLLRVFVTDFRFFIHSKAIYVLLALLTIIAVGNALTSLDMLKQNLSNFERTKSEHVANGEDVEKALQDEVHIQENKQSDDSVLVEIDNPVKYDFIQAGRSLFVLTREYYVRNTLEQLIFLFGPIFFPLLGLWFATYEFSNKTVKIRAIQRSWQSTVLAKQIFLIVLAVAVVCVYAITTGIVGIFIYNYAVKNVSNTGELLQGVVFVSHASLFVKILVSTFISSLLLLLGFSLGILFKKMAVPAGIILLYMLSFPIVGPYDLRSLIAVLGHEYFEFQGNFQYPLRGDASFMEAVWLLSLLFIALFVLNLVIAKRQSKYIS
ncbi:MAG: hypothetical protein WCP97_07070 [bacterium]